MVDLVLGVGDRFPGGKCHQGGDPGVQADGSQRLVIDDVRADMMRSHHRVQIGTPSGSLTLFAEKRGGIT